MTEKKETFNSSFLKEYNKVKEYNNFLKEEFLILSNELEKQNILDEIENNTNTFFDKILEYKICDSDIEKFVFELKPGVGGEESNIFLQELYSLYKRFFDNMNWSVSDLKVTNSNIRCKLKGKNIYKYLFLENGTHRVQRIPKTEKKDRIHTSTVVVNIFPDVYEIKDVKINEKDLKVETFRSSGAGGQHVNKTESAVRITHTPTGVVVQSQKERSQILNRKESMERLQQILNERESMNQQRIKYSDVYENLNFGQRCEKIKTYDFKINLVFDHRFKTECNLGLYFKNVVEFKRFLFNNFKIYLKQSLP